MRRKKRKKLRAPYEINNVVLYNAIPLYLNRGISTYTQSIHIETIQTLLLLMSSFYSPYHSSYMLVCTP